MLTVDLHAHVLHDVDDGPATLTESLDLCRALLAEGVRAVVAAPHVKPSTRTHPDVIRGRARELRSALAAAGIELEVLCGGELALVFAEQWRDEELAQYSPANNMLLLESPWGLWPEGVPELCAQLVDRGWRPVLAHPERNVGVQMDASVLDPVIATGVACHVTTEGLTGAFGSRVRACALELVRTGRVSHVVTDAHDVTYRPPAIGPARRIVADAFGEEVAVRLFESEPRRLLGRS